MKYNKKELIEYLRENKAKGINEITEALSWSKKKKKENSEFLKNLEEEAIVIKNSRNKYTLPEKSGLIKAKFEIVRGKFAFADTEDEGIFIPKSGFKDALTGDIVLVSLTRDGKDGRKKEGIVESVVKRSNKEIIGIFQYQQNFGFVKPRKNLGKDIFISKSNINRAKDNDLVVVEIHSWGDASKNPEGKIKEVLGDPYDTDIMLEALIKQNGYSEAFPRELMDEVGDINSITKEEISKRRDLRNLDIITIDGEDAKDLDDAVYVEKVGDGSYKLYVSIADVSYYIKENSKLDLEARKRGNSVYLVDRVIPMFPKEISNGICSLNANELRFAFTVEMTFDKDGKLIEDDAYKSVINVKHRMTYKNVNKILDKDEEILNKYKDIENLLIDMKELSHKIRKKRFKRGSIDFEFPETKVVLDANKKVEYIKTLVRGEAERIIEDFMIAANEAIAEKIFWVEMPSVYRTHEKPDSEKIKFLNQFLERFGYRIHNYEELHPGKFQAIIDDIKDKEFAPLLMKMILRSLKQAKYTLENIGHFGLSSNYYTHFTSPIRRYSDLMVHRILFDLVNGRNLNQKQFAKQEEKIKEISEYISNTERKASKAEEESIKIKLVEFMLKDVGKVYKGMISGMTKNGMFIELSNNVEAFFNTNESKSEYIFYENEYKILEKNRNKEYNIGEKLEVLITRVSLLELRIEVMPYEGD